jgi:predicted Rossmann fold flavoprotein
MEKHKVVVIGAGAAGMMAAGRCASHGVPTLLLEKNKYPGRKIGITGKGRCNLTTSIREIRDIIPNYPGNGKFLFSSLSQFSNLDTIEFFNSLGLKTVTERGQRVFPASERARDVVKALEKYLKQSKCRIRVECPVTEIHTTPSGYFIINTPKGKLEAEKVVLAVGGASYPGTGSTGDGYSLAKALGHTIVPIKPALVPLESPDSWVKDLQGLSLRNVKAEISGNSKILASEFGEMLFTHFGLSGPIILTLSRLAAQELEQGRTPVIRIDLKPALDQETLDRRVQRDLTRFQNKVLGNSLNKLLPNALILPLIRAAQLDPDKPANSITREERHRLVSSLKGLAVNISGTRPLAEAIVTAGGVSTLEVNPGTMESKLVPNLYFAGEILDIDGNTGGFNLQAAFSTGYVAGNHAAKGAVL